MITCGRCTKDAKASEAAILVEVGQAVQHDAVADVRACYAAPESSLRRALDDMYAAEAQAELAAEYRNERFWEDRGADDGFDEWERSRGVVQFSDAWDASDRAQGLEFSTRTGESIVY
jgi:hypothetical protein